MPDNRSLDSIDFPSLDFPYNRILREVGETPRLTAGTNCATTLGGKLIKRWGTVMYDTAATAFTKRIDRMWIYENLSGVIYLICSAYNPGSSNWGLYYSTIPTLSWTAVASLRQINASTRAHEAVVSRGILFVKGYPTGASGEKLGTIQFDTNSGSPVVSLWGLLGPSTPAAIVGAVNRLSADVTSVAVAITVSATTGYPAVPFDLYIDYEIMRATAGTYTVTRATQGTVAVAHVSGTPAVWKNWTASGHPVTVNFGWKYSYAYKTLSGHISNRAPLETNPDNLPSSTGPFINLRPKVTVQGNADTTNIPKIVIYRTTDGGGTFFKLEEITNTGAGAIIYEDKSLATGLGSVDPIPDNVLDGNDHGPSLTSNSPVPTVLAPLVVGTDTPVASTPMVLFQGRIWLAIGNYLFYSANEELNMGVPEEAWPSGTQGNFFRFNQPLLNLQPSSYALQIVTSTETHLLTGGSRDTFSTRLALTNVGAPLNHPRAITRFGNFVAWLTNDYRLAMLQGRQSNYNTDEFQVVSDPLYSDLVDIANANSANLEFELAFWSDLEKQFIVVAAHHKTDPTKSRQWLYDITKSTMTKGDYWFPPWTIQSTCLLVGRVSTTNFQRRLLIANWNGTNSGELTQLDPTGGTATDISPTGTVNKYDFSMRSNLFRVPPGDHVNALRRAGLTPVVHELRVDRTIFPNDDDPNVYFYFDDLWTQPKPSFQPEEPTQHDTSLGYRQLIYPVRQVAYRFAFQIDQIQSVTPFEIQDLAILFSPDNGS